MAEKGRRGRPAKVQVQDLIDGVDRYITDANPPILAEYAHLHGITRQRLYQLADTDPELFDAIKKLSEAKEVKLEKGAISGEYNSAMAIFSLKQLGWRDKPESREDSEALKKAKEILENVQGVIE